MNQVNNEKSLFEKLDHKKRIKSELVFYKLLAKQKAKANPFGVFRSETFPAKEIKPGADDV
jgi:hypothetical protein